MYRHMETCLQSNGISPAQARCGESFGALLVPGGLAQEGEAPRCLGRWGGRLSLGDTGLTRAAPLDSSICLYSLPFAGSCHLSPA